MANLALAHPSTHNDRAEILAVWRAATAGFRSIIIADPARTAAPITELADDIFRKDVGLDSAITDMHSALAFATMLVTIGLQAEAPCDGMVRRFEAYCGPAQVGIAGLLLGRIEASIPYETTEVLPDWTWAENFTMLLALEATSILDHAWDLASH